MQCSHIALAAAKTLNTLFMVGPLLIAVATCSCSQIGALYRDTTYCCVLCPKMPSKKTIDGKNAAEYIWQVEDEEWM